MKFVCFSSENTPNGVDPFLERDCWEKKPTESHKTCLPVRTGGNCTNGITSP